MKELTSADISLLGPLLRRWLPTVVREVWLIGSASIITWRLMELHASNPIPEDERIKVQRSLDAVSNLGQP